MSECRALKVVALTHLLRRRAHRNKTTDTWALKFHLDVHRIEDQIRSRQPAGRHLFNQTWMGTKMIVELGKVTVETKKQLPKADTQNGFRP